MHQLRILIVEDDLELAGLLSELLEVEGYNVTLTHQGRDALDFLDKSPKPDLVISDYMMPVMNGLQVYDAMHLEPENAGIPFLLMTATAAEALPEAARSLPFIAKPFDIQTMLDTVATLLTIPPLSESAETEIRSLQERLDVLLVRHSSLHAEAAILEERYAHLVEEIRALLAQIKEARDLPSAFAAIHPQLQVEHDSLISKHASIRRSKAQLDERIKEHRLAFARVREELKVARTQAEAGSEQGLTPTP